MALITNPTSAHLLWRPSKAMAMVPTDDVDHTTNVKLLRDLPPSLPPSGEDQGLPWQWYPLITSITQLMRNSKCMISLPLCACRHGCSNMLAWPDACSSHTCLWHCIYSYISFYLLRNSQCFSSMNSTFDAYNLTWRTAQRWTQLVTTR